MNHHGLNFKRVPEYLAETIEELLHFWSLSQQNEYSFRSSLCAHERAYIHKRAKTLGYYTITTREGCFSDRFVRIFKSKPPKALVTKYPLVVFHEILKKILQTIDKYPISTAEFRNFVLSRDYDDGSIGDLETLKGTKDYVDTEVTFVMSPTPTSKFAKLSSAINDYRKSLPIYQYKQIILNYLTDSKVVIIHGGVASGKSTQVPQYLMEKCLEAKVGYKIFLCEPYRITTVAIAERIAYERREEVGQSVGYQIPLETKKSATSVVICMTPDVLLKMLISKESIFRGKVIVIFDEFDEAGYMVEFLLITLKDLFKVNPYLRLILMGNMTDVTLLFSYFQYAKTDFDTAVKTACIPVASNLIPIQEFFLEDILMRTDYLNRSRSRVENNSGNSSIRQRSGNGFGDGVLNDSIEKKTMKVIDSAMDKVWNIGDDDVFIFLMNMMKKDVISVDYLLKTNGATVLMAASCAGKMKYVLELLKMGADATLRCENGLTALDWAMKGNNVDVIEALQYYLICNGEKVVSEREFIKLTASTNFNEHTTRLVEYYDNFYPGHGIDMELLFAIVLHVHAFNKPGALLVFLPCFYDILAFRDIIFEKETELVSSGGSFILRYLYANMQTSEQKLIFQTPQPDCRKIILSTNVGAVGITITDLVYVIDTGKIEQKMYGDHTGKISFVTEWISSSQGLQRGRRIGRLQPGRCYRLYSELMTLPEKNSTANLFTCSPQVLCLYTKQIVSSEVPVVLYLQRALTVLDESTIKQSIEVLNNIDAFDYNRNNEHMTELGKIMLQLPLEPQYAKMVLFAVALKCLDPILTIAAFSKHKSIFKLEQKYKSKSYVAAKEWKKISAKYFSDHLILIKMFLGRQEAGVEKREKAFCDEFCLSQSTLEMVNTTRSNIVGHLRAMGIVKTRGINDMRDLNANSKEWVFVKAALVGGLYPNLIFVDRTNSKLYCSKNRNEVLLHPLSTLLDYSHMPSNQTALLTQNDVIQYLPTDWLVSNEIGNAFSDKMYTASVCTAVTPTTLALFAGSYKICSAPQNQKTAFLIQNDTTDRDESDSENEEVAVNTKSFVIDPYLQFSMDEESAKAVLYLRIKWFSYFFRCLRFPAKAMTMDEKMVLENIASLLRSEEKYKFPLGDPSFIGQKPETYSVDLFQQPNHNEAISDVNLVTSSPAVRGLITENSRYFLIKSYAYNNIQASFLSEVWKFEPITEQKIIEAYTAGADVKLIFQFDGTNCFQGMAILLNDRYCDVENKFLPIRWLNDGLVPMTTVEDYLDYVICNKLKNSIDGTEIDCSLANTLVSMWNTYHMSVRIRMM